MSGNPQVSVLINAYNAGSCIERAIKSVLAQSFEDFELVIVNDGSTDDTELRVSGFDDPRIVYVHREHQGISSSLNAGLALARGKYIAKLDADDVAYAARLERQVELLEANPEYVLCGAAADIVSADGTYLYTQHEPTSDEAIRSVMRRRNCFIHSTTFYRRDVARRVGGYPVFFKRSEDHFLVGRLLQQGLAMNCEQPLISYTVGPYSASSKRYSRKERMAIQRIIDRGYCLNGEREILEGLEVEPSNRRRNEHDYHLFVFRMLLTRNVMPMQAFVHFRQAVRHRRMIVGLPLSIVEICRFWTWAALRKIVLRIFRS